MHAGGKQVHGTAFHRQGRDAAHVEKHAYTYMHTHMQDAGKYKALLFTDKAKTPLMWRGVSVDLKGKMTLGVVQKEDKVMEHTTHCSKPQHQCTS